MLCVQASELCVLFVKNQLHVLIFMLEWFIQNCLNGLVQVTILSLYTLYKTPYCEYFFLDCGKKFKRKFDLNRTKATLLEYVNKAVGQNVELIYVTKWLHK